MEAAYSSATATRGLLVSHSTIQVTSGHMLQAGGCTLTTPPPGLGLAAVLGPDHVHAAGQAHRLLPGHSGQEPGGLAS